MGTIKGNNALSFARRAKEKDFTNMLEKEIFFISESYKLKVADYNLKRAS